MKAPDARNSVMFVADKCPALEQGALKLDSRFLRGEILKSNADTLRYSPTTVLLPFPGETGSLGRF